MPPEPPKVFISYNRTDRDWAEWIAVAIDRGSATPIFELKPGSSVRVII
jgi:hypothetical protein